MSILENAKQVADAVHEIKNLELYERVLSLRTDIMDLVEENKRLHEENDELTKKLALQKTMTFRPPFFYQEGDPSPFCPACWQETRKAIYLIYSHEEETCIRWDCKTCNQPFVIDKPPQSQQITSDPSYVGENTWMR